MLGLLDIRGLCIVPSTEGLHFNTYIERLRIVPSIEGLHVMPKDYVSYQRTTFQYVNVLKDKGLRFVPRDS